jgi:competence protein ComEA
LVRRPFRRSVKSVNSLDFDRRTLAILAAVLAAAVGLTAFFTRTPSPQPAGAVAASPTPVLMPSPVASVRPSPSPSGEVVVEVVGKVHRPSVVTLPAGSRVQDALEAVGGARPGVDTSDQNLARVLTDGEQIRIGLEPAPAQAQGPPTAQPGGVVDLNTASLEALQTIPGVGPVIAARIVTYREQNGGFRAVEELLEVSGIGEVTFAQMQPMVTVGAGG